MDASDLVSRNRSAFTFWLLGEIRIRKFILTAQSIFLNGQVNNCTHSPKYTSNRRSAQTTAYQPTPERSCVCGTVGVDGTVPKVIHQIANIPFTRIEERCWTTLPLQWAILPKGFTQYWRIWCEGLLGLSLHQQMGSRHIQLGYSQLLPKIIKLAWDSSAGSHCWWFAFGLQANDDTWSFVVPLHIHWNMPTEVKNLIPLPQILTAFGYHRVCRYII